MAEARAEKTDRGSIMGGPFDGINVKLGGKRKGLFAWISEEGRPYDKPGPGRRLHRAELWRYSGTSVLAWVYAEGLWTLCEGCGAFHRRGEGGVEQVACPLCGQDE